MYYVHVTVHRNKFLYNKTKRCTNFPNLLWLKNEPLHVSGISSAHHQEVIHCTLGTSICQDGPARKLSSNLYDIYQCQVCSEWPDGGQRKCPKHVEVHFLAKVNLGNWCIFWFYYKEKSHVLYYLKILLHTTGNPLYTQPCNNITLHKNTRLFPHIWKFTCS
jgi:hypothetical protein